MTTNTVYVTDDPADLDLAGDTFELEQPHWIGEPPRPGQSYQARVRYRAGLVSAVLEPALGESRGGAERWVVRLDQPERAISPGQSAVICTGDEVLGGGIIAGR